MRKPRPFTRDENDPRDTRLILVACDDTYAPKQYFDFFDKYFTRVKVRVQPTENGEGATAENVLNRLLEYTHEDDDELWMVLDTDHYIHGNHQKEFYRALEEAERQNVKVALSRPCFELWLLLHYVDYPEVSSLNNAREVEDRLRSEIGEYNKTKLKIDHYSLDRVVSACKRASECDKTVCHTHKPDANSSRVFLIWNSAVTKALEAQLPSELVKYKRFLEQQHTT
jgi:hypothetical protein